MSRVTAAITTLGAVVAAAFAPVTISAPAELSFRNVDQVVRLNTACAQEDEAGSGCKFNMAYICETSNGNHRYYRNVEVSPT